MFNINKYKGKKFHNSEAVHKKIEALFLLYDKKVHDGKLNYKGRIALINIFISDLIRFEEYEVAQAFKERKFRKYKKWREQRRNGKIPFKVRLRLARLKIRRFIIRKLNS